MDTFSSIQSTPETKHFGHSRLRFRALLFITAVLCPMTRVLVQNSELVLKAFLAHTNTPLM